MAKKKGGDDGRRGESRGASGSAPRSSGSRSGSSASEDNLSAWKGFEEEEEDDDPAVMFGGLREPSDDDDLDMTPMIDVTFLLLIFFMVTASFTLQKSIEQPQAETDDPSTQVIEKPEDAEDYVEVIIDQTNTFYEISRDEEVEAPTVRDMRAKVRDAKQSLNAKRMVITAHTDSKHSLTVAAWDAAQVAELFEVQTRITEEDY